MAVSNGQANGEDRVGAVEPTTAVTYCIVPRTLAPQLYDYLRKHWQDEPSLRVVIERRGGERRGGARRPGGATPAPAAERRQLRNVEGRRVGERRALAVPVTTPPLPRRIRRYAEQLTFVERVEPSGRAAEDLETNRLILQYQGGDQCALETLYMRYFERVYGYARLLLRSFHDAEDAAQQVFANVLEALPRYEIRPDQPFRFWLFRITRNTSLKALERSGRLHLEDADELEQRMARPAPDSNHQIMDWLSDSDLAILVERLPVAQRQCLVLRYALELTTDEIARVLDRSPQAVRLLQHRALRALEGRLTAIREAGGVRRTPMRVRVKPLPVLASRRFALGPASPPGLIRRSSQAASSRPRARAA
jgi:RNA polymerase sigma-70 factor (ECF subfamily)